MTVDLCVIYCLICSHKLFINGEFVESVEGGKIPVIDPATEQQVCEVSEGGPKDIDLAVQAAHKAFQLGSEWRTMDASKRGRFLYLLADAVQQHAEELTALEALDTGKPIESARGDVCSAVDKLRYFAGFADKIHGQVCFSPQLRLKALISRGKPYSVLCV